MHFLFGCSPYPYWISAWRRSSCRRRAQAMHSQGRIGRPFALGFDGFDGFGPAPVLGVAAQDVADGERRQRVELRQGDLDQLRLAVLGAPQRPMDRLVAPDVDQNERAQNR